MWVGGGGDGGAWKDFVGVGGGGGCDLVFGEDLDVGGGGLGGAINGRGPLPGFGGGGFCETGGLLLVGGLLIGFGAPLPPLPPHLDLLQSNGLAASEEHSLTDL